MATYSITTLATPQQAWFALKSAAARSLTRSFNWEVGPSSTGLGGVMTLCGDVIASAAQLGTYSWFVLRGHGFGDGLTTRRRSICVQVDAAGGARITYSPAAGFTIIGSTIQVPSALDGQLLWGGGTDASPTFAPLWPAPGSRLLCRFGEGDDAFQCLAYSVGGGLPTAALLLETVPSAYAIGGLLLDPDPCVLHVGVGVAVMTAQDLASEARGPRGLMSAWSPTDRLWARLPAATLAVLDVGDVARTTTPGGEAAQSSPALPPPAYTTETMRFMRRVAVAGSTLPGEVGASSTVGVKGEGYYLRWSGHRFADPTLVRVVDPLRGFEQSGHALGVGDVLMPWDDAYTPPL